MKKNILILTIFLSLILIISLLIISYQNNTEYKEDYGSVLEKPPYQNYCEVKEDCGASSCCHPNSTINKYFAPDCGTGIICTHDCKSILDCKRWQPTCENNICGYEIISQ